MDTQICTHWCYPNSGKEVSAQSYTLHEAHCKRNYEHCECGQFIKLSEKPSHLEEKHTVKKCGHCGLEAAAYLLPLHECSNKPRTCQFCQAEISADDFKEHLYICSSRTQHCQLCLKYIPNRGEIQVDFDHHSSLCTGPGSIPDHSASPTEAHMATSLDTDLLRAQLMSEGHSPEEVEMLLAVKVSEEMDRAYAEHVERRLIMESLEEEHQERNKKAAQQYTPMDVEDHVEESPVDIPHEEILQ